MATPPKPPREYVTTTVEGKFLVGRPPFLVGHQDAAVVPVGFTEALALQKKVKGRGKAAPGLYRVVEVDGKGKVVGDEN